MPIYTFKCNNCGKDFDDLIQSSNKEIKCPYCGSKNIRKKSIYNNNFKFIGNGFYENDYKKHNK